jgi:hypothetical protein
MKKFSMTEIAVLFAAPTMMALVPMMSIANKVSKGMDTLMPTANYTMIIRRTKRSSSALWVIARTKEKSWVQFLERGCRL